MAAQINTWLNTFDFIGTVPKWSSAISDEDLLPIIQLAQDGLRMRLPAALYTAVNTIAVAKYNQWSKNKTYALNDRVLWENRLYRALGATTNNEPPNATYWTEIELWTVYRDYLKPYIIWQSAADYVPFADMWFTQEGTRRVTTANNEPLVPEEVAMMTNNFQGKADRYFLGYRNWMDDNSYTIDGTEYRATSSDDVKEHKTKPKIRIV